MQIIIIFYTKHLDEIKQNHSLLQNKHDRELFMLGTFIRFLLDIIVHNWMLISQN